MRNNSFHINLTFFACIFYSFCAIVMGNGTIITILSKVILIFAAIYKMLSYNANGNKNTSKMYYLWCLVIASYMSITLLWTVDLTSSFYTLSSFLIVIICNIALFYLLSFNNTYSNRLLKWFVIFTMILILRAIVEYGFSIFVRAPGQNSEFNLNLMGMNCAMTCLFSYYLLRISPEKRAFYWIVIAISFIFIILSGSKKALIIPFVAFVVMMICHSNKKQIITTIIWIIVLTCVLNYALFNIEILYDSIGYRFEGLINGLTGQGTVDASSKGRLMFIEYGMYLFKLRPLLGYGIATFAHLYGQTVEVGEYVAYSHNNYIELLVSGGLVGLILYYWIYLYLIFRLIKIIKKTKADLPILFLSILIGSMFGQYGFVSYYDLTANIILTIVAYKTLYWKDILQKNMPLAIKLKLID